MSSSTPAARRTRAVLGGLAGSLAALAVLPGLAGAAFADTPSTGATRSDAAPQDAAPQNGAAQSYGAGQSSGAAPSDGAAQPGLGLPTLPTLPKVPGLPTAALLGGSDPVAEGVGGALSASSLLGTDGAPSADDPTPAPQGAQYGAKPETVVGGVPVEGLLNSVAGAQAIVPGSGPKDYA
ncbi:hypothetical protein [Actinomycetospora sp. TBRC 11914]|uniref:hypothetical protein n=1 Tax=Actinomycetospora sp. TBRC 11914 TaxID=2729387 RepID=UPI00145F6FB0|nr:hypothetical protein [Actinomycetospora sp. TBRC 11914]NMO91439.1 hypothetical protein [Actinomycetospora sp. TBRC 11914]